MGERGRAIHSHDTVGTRTSSSAGHVRQWSFGMDVVVRSVERTSGMWMSAWTLC